MGQCPELSSPTQSLWPDTLPEHQDPVIHTPQKKREKKEREKERKEKVIKLKKHILLKIKKLKSNKRRTQPNQKTNPQVITSAKTIIKKTNQKTDRQNPRTNGKSKPIQTKSHKEAYTYTFTKREKGKKYIYI